MLRSLVYAANPPSGLRHIPIVCNGIWFSGSSAHRGDSLRV